MFLFSAKTKTPISTYKDSYRAPTSIKEVYKDPALWAWEPNKFVTRGLTQTMERHMDPDALQKMIRCAVQEYSCKNSIPGHPYFPEKYWLSQEEAERCCPNYLYGNQCVTWRTGPCNSICWNKYTTCLPPLSKETGMEMVVRQPLECPPKPERLNAYEREVVANMLNSLSRRQPLPQITPRCACMDPLPGRLPCQGYESPCSGRHYCLRGMNYCVAGPTCLQRRLRPVCCTQPTVRAVFSHHYRPGLQCAVTAAPPPYYPYPNLRWDTSHFKRTGGALKNNYIIHPEFVSESYPEYGCW
ncbi:PREDICTED: spermatid-specific manchette-related protein 1 isoform X1 [Elephantulus edwardii]|uniref:spermatid-specific manchette-related protein 1 isoform X1 n=1 Tax=Elephantulus edwardii TaxID=28737 RepID=UPI0003F0DDDB|nr:PREDICTED: spermatid-specific manchette-related protein 1 isoform X1 [Elephantulus edwardii]